MTVNVFNNNGGNIRTEEKRGPGGMRQLDVYIEGKVADFMGGEQGSKLMNAKFGMRPTVARRSRG